MTDKEKLINAQKIYKIICDYFDKNKWVYTKTEDKLRVNLSMQGDNMPMEIALDIDVKRELINLYVKLSFVFNDEKRIDGSLATSLINYRLYDEAFDYNVKSGEVYLRQTASYRGSVVTVTLIFTVTTLPL